MKNIVGGESVARFTGFEMFLLVPGFAKPHPGLYAAARLRGLRTKLTSQKALTK